MKKIFLFLVLLMLLLFPLCAQDSPAAPAEAPAAAAKALVIYAEGKGFTVSRGEKTEFIDFKTGNALDYEFLAGDLINVEAGTVLEIQLYPSRTRLRVAESSTFRLGTVNQDGSGNIEVLYGSIRTKSDDKLTAGVLAMKGLHTVNATEGADFQLDMIYNPGSTEILNRVYCLAGNVEVIPAPRDAAASPVSPAADGQAASGQPAAEKIVLKAREMVTIKLDAPAIAGTSTGISIENSIENSTGTPDTRAAVQEIVKESIAPEIASSLQAENQFIASEKEPVANTALSPVEASRPEPEAVAAEDSLPVPEEKLVIKPESFRFFRLGAGAEASFMFINAALLTSANPLQDGLIKFSSLADIGTFLLCIRYGPVVDLLLLLNPVLGLGFEGGFLYSTVTIENITLNLFNIPLLFIVSLTPGPLFIQWGGGLVGIGGLVSVKDPSSGEVVTAGDMVWYFETGLKLGVKIDRYIGYIGCLADAKYPDSYFKARIDLRVNLGAAIHL